MVDVHISKCIFVKKQKQIYVDSISLNFVPKGPVENKLYLLHVTFCHLFGTEAFEPMVITFNPKLTCLTGDSREAKHAVTYVTVYFVLTCTVVLARGAGTLVDVYNGINKEIEIYNPAEAIVIALSIGDRETTVASGTGIYQETQHGPGVESVIVVIVLYSTHWGRDEMDAITQTTFSSAFFWKKMFEFRLKFHWSLFLRVE